MKFLFSLLLFLSALRISSAQTVLKAGTYRQLVASQLGLDTGDFVLVDVEIRSSEKDSCILLDARIARSLRLEHSRLYGSGQQTGLATSGKLSLGHSRFENLKPLCTGRETRPGKLKCFVKYLRPMKSPWPSKIPTVYDRFRFR